MRTTWVLTKVRMKLAMRNRAFLFFSLIMPLAFLFVYAIVFGRGEPRGVRFLLPSVLALTVMGSFWGLSIQLVLFREQGILRRFRLAPIGPGAMLASNVISNYLLTLPTLVVELALARWLWGVSSFGNVWGMFVFLTMGIITFASFGLIVASIANSMQETQVINNLIWFLFLFFSGATFPLVFFPGWLQRFALFLPATHLITGLQFVFLGGQSVWSAGAELLGLVVGTAMALYVSLKLFRWEPEEKIPRKAKLAAAVVVIPFLLLGAWENAAGQRRRQVLEIYRNALPTAPATSDR